MLAPNTESPPAAHPVWDAGGVTRLGAYVNDDNDSKHTIDIPLTEEGSLEKAVFVAVEGCLEKIDRLEKRAAQHLTAAQR